MLQASGSGSSGTAIGAGQAAGRAAGQPVAAAASLAAAWQWVLRGRQLAQCAATMTGCLAAVWHTGIKRFGRRGRGAVTDFIQSSKALSTACRAC